MSAHLPDAAYGLVCIRRTKRRGKYIYAMSLTYLVEKKQLTKDSEGLRLVISRMPGSGLGGREARGKDFHTKHFHTDEVTFGCRAFIRGCELTNGRENFSATRLYPSPCCIRNTLARRFRATGGKVANAAKGALGISSETCAALGIEWRTAISIPPAETFKAVANSRNSLSASSARLLTKTGIAKGRRGQRRRSPAADLPFTRASLFNHHLSFLIKPSFTAS